MWILCAPDTQILFVNITTEVEMGFVANYDFWYEIILFFYQV